MEPGQCLNLIRRSISGLEPEKPVKRHNETVAILDDSVKLRIACIYIIMSAF